MRTEGDLERRFIMDEKVKSLYEELATELNLEYTMKNITTMTEDTPYRVSGFGQDKKAAEFICKKLAEYGCDETGIQEFHTYNSRPGTSKFTLIEPKIKEMESLPCCHVEATPEGGGIYEVVYVGSGGEEDYIGKDVVGKAVLVEVSYAPATPEKAVIAEKKGASAMICMNWGPIDQKEICMRGLKGVWGNPTPESYQKIPKIVGCSISRPDGEYLRDLCKNGNTVKIKLKVTAERLWETLAQPYAIIKGSEEPEKFLLISAHLEAWGPGVTDNATGDATQMEIARVLARHKDKLKRSVYFVFWNGHEIAEAAGSTWFADYFWDELSENCIGYYNIDSTGMKGTKIYQADASRELKDFALEMGGYALGEEVRYNTLRKIGDQSFFGLGIPSIFGHMCFDDEELARTNGASFGWWNHTTKDTLDKVSLENLDKDNKAQLAYVLGIVNSEILPYNFEYTARDINEKVQDLVEHTSKIMNLTKLKEQAERLVKNVEVLNSFIHSVPKSDQEICSNINHVLIKLSRTLTGPFYTATDKYSQDSYGLSILSKPIPLLYPLYNMLKMSDEDLEYKLQYTQMLRNRNYLTDSLRVANDWIETLLK